MIAAPAPFELHLLPTRLAFGAGVSGQLAERLSELGVRRALVVGTAAAERRHHALLERLDGRSFATFFAAEPHCPEPVVERCRAVYLDAGCDGVVAVGGGSTLGLGKILAAEQGAKFIALPTTYSGSEMTPLYGRKIGTEKRVRSDPRCRPELVLYDPVLTEGLPARVAVATGMNSVAHAVEALYPQRPNPLAPWLAEQALLAHREGLTAIARGAPSTEALGSALYGGFLGGWLVALCGIALHHQLCHVLGGLFDLPHSETNSVVLPHALAYNAPAVPAACAVVARVFGGASAPAALYDFVVAIGAPSSLRELGMPESGIAPVVDAMLARRGYNPRPLERDGLTGLVRAAFTGERPS